MRKKIATSPTVWNIEGNAIGNILGDLTQVPQYNNRFAQLSQGEMINFEGHNLRSLILTYRTDNLLNRSQSRTLALASFSGHGATIKIEPNPLNLQEPVLSLIPAQGVAGFGMIEPANLFIPPNIRPGNVLTASAEIFIPKAAGLTPPFHNTHVGFIINNNWSGNDTITKTGSWQRVVTTQFIPTGTNTINFVLYNQFNNPPRKVFYRRFSLQNRNLCHPNAATGGDFLGNSSYINSGHGNHTIVTTWSAEGTRSIRSNPVNHWIGTIIQHGTRPNTKYNLEVSFRGVTNREYVLSIQMTGYPFDALFRSTFIATGGTQHITRSFTTPTNLPLNTPLFFIVMDFSGNSAYYIDRMIFQEPISDFSPGRA